MMQFTYFRELLMADRSFRRFDNNFKISNDTLVSLVELTRWCASGRNLQPLKYRIVNTEEECEKIFPHLKWAGYYTDWDGPSPEERPTAYLVQCLDTHLTDALLCDDGLQLQAITLGATTLGLGGCIIKAFNAGGVAEALALPDNLVPRYVLALGKPVETIKVEDLSDAEGDYKYFRTPDQMHHVPKRTLDQLVISKDK